MKKGNILDFLLPPYCYYFLSGFASEEVVRSIVFIKEACKRESKLVTILLIMMTVTFTMSMQSAFAITDSWDTALHFLGDGGVGATNNVFVTDVGANTSKIDTVTVLINSTSDPIGIPLTLTETSNNSATFTNTNIIFTEGNYLIPLGRTVTVTIKDLPANFDPSTIDILPVMTFSTSTPGGFMMFFSETGVNTGIFSSKVTFATVMSGSSGTTLNVTAGDEYSIIDTSSSLASNGIVTANNNPGFGAIIAHINDTVTVSYQGIFANTVIGDDTNPGGIGGGLVTHPGFVLDFIAAMGGSPYIVSPPSFGGRYYHYSDGLTLTQGDTTTTFDTSHYNQEIPKQVMVSGTPINMTFKTFESYNVEGVIHMGLYLVPRGEDMVTDNSIASIVWDKGRPVEVNDPNHILSDVTVSLTDDGKFQYTTFSFTPTKSYDKMSFLVRAWNDHLYSTDIRIHDDIVKPQAAQTLPAGVIQYDKFDDLQAALEKDQFYKPQLLSHIHGTTAVFPNSEGGSVYWLYDTIQHTVTLVIADKNDNVLSSQSAVLQPYAVEKKGDYKFMYFTVQQLNRWNEDQLKNAMELETAKAMSSALEKGIVPHSNW